MERFSYTRYGTSAGLTYRIRDNKLCREICWCRDADVAQRVVDALNAHEAARAAP